MKKAASLNYTRRNSVANTLRFIPSKTFPFPGSFLLLFLPLSFTSLYRPSHTSYPKAFPASILEDPAHSDFPITSTIPLHHDFTKAHCNNSIELDSCPCETNVSQHLPFALLIQMLFQFMQIDKSNAISKSHICMSLPKRERVTV